MMQKIITITARSEAGHLLHTAAIDLESENITEQLAAFLDYVYPLADQSDANAPEDLRSLEAAITAYRFVLAVQAARQAHATESVEAARKHVDWSIKPRAKNRPGRPIEQTPDDWLNPQPDTPADIQARADLAALKALDDAAAHTRYIEEDRAAAARRAVDPDDDQDYDDEPDFEDGNPDAWWEQRDTNGDWKISNRPPTFDEPF